MHQSFFEIKSLIIEDKYYGKNIVNNVCNSIQC